jgi:hypothetical protein
LSARRSTTDWEAEGFVPEAALPIGVSLLRWKLGRKAKQAPRFRSYTFKYGYPRRVFASPITTCGCDSRAFYGIGVNGAAARFGRARVCMRAWSAMGSRICDGCPSPPCVGLEGDACR